MFRDAEPGKIAHELRFGEKTAFEDTPHSPYYGTADATPLFLILLDEYERWTGDGELVQNLEEEARAALAWIERYGDRTAMAIWSTSAAARLAWKTSAGKTRGTRSSMPTARIPACRGRPARSRGTSTTPSYAARGSRAEYWGDPNLAERLEREAGELKRRFNQDFWIADRGYFALALDGEKRQVDSLTSNIGHLLWSGIVESDKIEAWFTT